MVYSLCREASADQLLGEAITLLLQVGLELLVLLPRALLGPPFSHFQHGLDLVDLVLREIQRLQLLDNVVLRTLLFILFLGIEELVRSGGIVLKELRLDKAGDLIRANVQLGQARATALGSWSCPASRDVKFCWFCAFSPAPSFSMTALSSSGRMTP